MPSTGRAGMAGGVSVPAVGEAVGCGRSIGPSTLERGGSCGAALAAHASARSGAVAAAVARGLVLTPLAERLRDGVGDQARDEGREQDDPDGDVGDRDLPGLAEGK